MARIGFICILVLLVACSNHDEKKVLPEEEAWDTHFQKKDLPYTISGVELKKFEDTAGITVAFSALIPDTILQQTLGTVKKISLLPVAMFELPKGGTYYLLKAKGNNKEAAILVFFDKATRKYASISFLIPDKQQNTSQESTIDKDGLITKARQRNERGTVSAEGKDIYTIDQTLNEFTLVATDLLDQSTAMLNPIDTFPATNKLSGDYLNGKKNLISIRDGRREFSLRVFIHIDNGKGCIGELKGDFLIASSTTALYRESGDPCVLMLRFEGKKVSIQEDQGCGNHRDLDCLFEGTFVRKKSESTKASSGSK